MKAQREKVYLKVDDLLGIRIVPADTLEKMTKKEHIEYNTKDICRTLKRFFRLMEQTNTSLENPLCNFFAILPSEDLKEIQKHYETDDLATPGLFSSWD